MNQPSVSIIVPVYNVGPYVEDCIRSVMRQTYTGPMECIIVDDCGTDNSMEIVKRLITEYDGSISFKILHHTHNRGLSAARNTGMGIATGDYVFFLDSDDELTPDCLEKLTNPILKDDSIEMVMGNHNVVSNGSLVFSSNRPHFSESDLASQKAVRDFYFSFRNPRFPVEAWNKLTKKDFLECNNISFIEGILFEDNPWLFLVIKHLRHLYIVSDVTYFYHKRPYSLTTGASVKEDAHYHAIVFHEIASHFSPGDEAREATYYIQRFMSYLYQFPKEPIYHQTIPLFRHALSDGHHRSELTRLFMIQMATSSIAGKCLFLTMRETKKVCVYPIKAITDLLSPKKRNR